MLQSNMHVLHDTREQQPLTWRNFRGELIYNITIGRDTLTAGDYTIAGHDLPGDDNSIIIERKKDCKEFVVNLVAKWDVFQNELKLMAQYKNRQIIVCAPENFDVLYRQGLTKVSPNFAWSRIADIQTYYQIPVIFFDNREKAQEYLFRLFYSIIKKTKGEN